MDRKVILNSNKTAVAKNWLVPRKFSYWNLEVKSSAAPATMFNVFFVEGDAPIFTRIIKVVKFGATTSILFSNFDERRKCDVFVFREIW